MHFDDFIAQQIIKTNDPSSRPGGVHQPVGRLFRILWSGLRQVAWGSDAFFGARHGIDGPPTTVPVTVPCGDAPRPHP